LTFDFCFYLGFGMKQTWATVSSSVEVMPATHLMWIEAPDVAAAGQPGQFITVRCGDFTLRRPFGIHQSSPLTGEDSEPVLSLPKDEGDVAILFKVTGKGTLWLSQRQPGDKIDIFGPLGNGFTIRPESRRLLLVAGGIGIAPLVFLMQQTSPRHQITLIHGAATATQLYPFPSAGKKQSGPSSLPKGVQYVPVTEDGSLGQKGRVTDLLPDFLGRADQVYACGPVDMYKTMAEMSLPVPKQSRRSNLKLEKCQVSLEVRMGCGFGACYGCTIDTRKGLKRVCRDGPVFELQDIIWQEIRV
jgi:dihydroorotate dehydrogenase electron transfer subunit